MKIKIDNSVKNKENPTVSAIIPTYNRAQLLPRSVQSVLNQTLQNFEIIIVDDGSIDNTEEIVKEFQRKDKRIRYIKQERNKGAGAARNVGIKAARGEYIAFIDSDDEWLPEKLEKHIKVFKNAPSEVGVVYAGCWRIENDKKMYIPQSWVTKKEGDIHQELMERGIGFIITNSLVVKKSAFKKVGLFDEGLPSLEEWELAIRLSRYYSFRYINEALSQSVMEPDSISISHHAAIKAYKLILERHYEEFKKNKRLLAKHLYAIGISLCHGNDLDQGRSYLFRAVRAYPLSIKYLVVAFISLFGQEIYKKIIDIYHVISFVRNKHEK